MLLYLHKLIKIYNIHKKLDFITNSMLFLNKLYIGDDTLDIKQRINKAT